MNVEEIRQRIEADETEIIAELTPELLIEIVLVAQETGASFNIEAGELTLTLDGQTVRFVGTQDMLASVAAPQDALLQLLNTDPAALFTLADQSGFAQLAEFDLAFRDVIISTFGNEAGGSSGTSNNSSTGNASILSENLTPLISPTALFAINLQQTSFANLFSRVRAGVGEDIGHLPPLPDEDNMRGDDPTFFRARIEETEITQLLNSELTNETGAVSQQRNDEAQGDSSVSINIGSEVIVTQNGNTNDSGSDSGNTGNSNGSFGGSGGGNSSGGADQAGGPDNNSGDGNQTPPADQVLAASVMTSDEDVTISLSGVAQELKIASGTDTYSKILLTDVPPGAQLNVGTDIGGGRYELTLSELSALLITPPQNTHGAFDIQLEAKPIGPNGTEFTQRTTVTLDMKAVADAPMLGSDMTLSTSEDTAVAIGSIAGGLSDTDGSETLSYRIESVPAGVAFDTGTNAGGGIWLFTPTELAGAHLTPPANWHGQMSMTLIATATEASNGDSASATRNITVNVAAQADTPGGTSGDVSGNEDASIALNIQALASSDTDGSEILSVRLTNIPAGSIVSGDTSAGASFSLSGDDWVIEAPDLVTLNAALATTTFQAPEHFSGVITARLEVIATEQAVGSLVAVKSSTASYDFDITVSQIADTPELLVIHAVAGASGVEDTPIRLIVDIRPGDNDGSEILSEIVIGNIPTGATIVDAGGVAIGVNLGGGEVRLQASQLADLHILPPANSSADFQLTITASATESSQGLSGDGDVAIVTTTLDVSVTGVADAPSLVAAPLVIAEGQPIALGSAIGATLADTDGSEKLFFVIEGLPAGIIPSVGNFIGGKWQIAAGDIAGLTLSAAANFSGAYVSGFATDLKVFAVTQENDGHQTVTQVPLDITVTPTVDGALWTPAVQISEGANISLSAAAPLNLIDTDGSEIIVDYTFDLNSFIVSAGVSGSVSTTQDLIDSHITGVFTDNGNGTITIQASDLSSVSIDQTALVDSNLDFAIPFTVRFNDAGVVATASKSLAVDIVGVADLPTVFAVDVSGHANTPLPLSLGGTTTDIDISLGRAQSEEIYYVVSGLAAVGVDVALTDSTGSPVGLNNGDGTWVLQTSDLADLHVTAAQGQTGNRTLTVTTVATENDGDRTMASVNFDVTITHGGGIGIPVLPKLPLVDIRVMATSEDNPAILDVEILVDPTDLTTSLADITVVLSDIPSGVEVSGAIYNPVTGNWVTTALNINTGAVIFTPAADFSGILNFTLAAVATTGPLASVVNAANAATIVVLPVTDTPLITISGAGTEDNATPLAITVGVSDIDGSETIVDPIRITLSHGALSAGNHVGGGVWEITLTQLSGLTLTTDPHFSGDVSVTVEATARELTGSTASLSASATVQVAGTADQATISVAASAGVEDSAINLVGLGASLVDLDGSETLTTIITGVPGGTILSAGANNGDGSWTVAAADLATLSLTPPQNWSGVMNLELVAFTRESSDHTSEIRQGFTVTVDAVADPVVFMALPVTAAVGVETALNLQLISGDDTSAGGSENPAEIMVVDLQAATHFITTATGGLLECLGLGHWRFIGTEAEANLLGIVGYGAPRDLNLTVSAFARDGASEGTPNTQNLTVTLTGSGQTLEGSVAADTLSGGNGADLLRGAGGADILSGGAGADLFIWADGDLAGGVTDIISDFSQSEDVLDLSALVTSYDPATEAVSDYISLVETAGNTFVRIDTSGSGTFTVDAIELTAVTGLDLTTMIATGALIA